MPKLPPFPSSDRDGDRSAPDIEDIVGRILQEPGLRDTR